MDDWQKEQLHVMADNIRAKLAGSKLYGHPIDFDDPDMMIVATYSLANHEWSIKNIQELELAYSILC